MTGSVASLVAIALFAQTAPRMVPADSAELSVDGGVVSVGAGCWLREDACIAVGQRVTYARTEAKQLERSTLAPHFELGLVFAAGLLLGATVVFVARDWLKIPAWPWH